MALCLRGVGILILLVKLAACSEDTGGPEVRVIIDAPEAVKARTEQVEIEIWDETGFPAGEVRGSFVRMPRVTGWPIVAPLQPDGGDVERGFDLIAWARAEDGTRIGTARLRQDSYELRTVERELTLECFAANYRRCVMNDRPVAYYPFEEFEQTMDGETTRDEIGGAPAVLREEDTSAPGPLQVPGAFGCGDMAVELTEKERIDPLVDFEASDENRIFARSPFSIELWFSPVALGMGGEPNTSLYFALGTDGGEMSGFRFRFERVGSNGQFVIGFVAGTQLTASVEASDDFHHVVLTASRPIGGSESEVSLYIDGSLRAGPMSAELLTSDGGELGAYRGTFANGRYDELAIYDEALSPEQVMNHWLARRGDHDCVP
ncbi:MAG: LamG domain-containing protein [Myxococcota bacterium]